MDGVDGWCERHVVGVGHLPWRLFPCAEGETLRAGGGLSRLRWQEAPWTALALGTACLPGLLLATLVLHKWGWAGTALRRARPLLYCRGPHCHHHPGPGLPG